jgi:hypothetical protein
MTKLSDTQAVILANASQSFDGNVLPLPGSLRGGAQAKVIAALLKRGLIEERTIDSIQPPDGSLTLESCQRRQTGSTPEPTSKTAVLGGHCAPDSRFANSSCGCPASACVRGGCSR